MEEEFDQLSDASETDENPSFFESSCPGGQMFLSSENMDSDEENIYYDYPNMVREFGNAEPSRKRGPYKLYLTSQDREGIIDLPKTTKWRRLQNNLGLESDVVGDDANSESDSAASARDVVNDNDIDNDVYIDAVEDFQLFECDDQPENNDEDSDDDSDQNEETADQNYEPEDIDKPVYDGAPITVAQCLLLLMSFILGNNLTGAAITNLLKLLHLILPTSSRLPSTKYLFDKHFNAFKTGMEFKFYCPICKTLLDNVADVFKCPACDLCYQKQQLLQQGNFFIYLPLEKQMQDLFRKNGENLDLNHRFTRQKLANDAIEDIYDGQQYKTMAGGCLNSDPNCLSVTFNCDGVPIFKSSNFSIWPLQGILNELPPKQRKQNVFLLGLWFGTGKPLMTSFLHPFTEEIRKLSTIGLDLWRGGVNVCSRVFACICSCDSVARCILQNIHQFNGQFGCSWCNHPGETIAKGRGHSRVYVEGLQDCGIRTHSEMERNGQRAYRKGETVLGVKGPTKLSSLPHFNITRGFVVDNLHCIDLGVARQLGHLWFDSSNHQNQWYLGRHIDCIDSKLKTVMPPHEVTRIPRSVSQRAFWKGSEWHWWLLLYSPVILAGLLPSQYFKHLLLLVEGVFLLSKSSISRADINKASCCLSKFVRKFQHLYGKSNMTYNVHQLSHLTQTVIDWGPLPVYSAYIFEGFNLVLLRLFHGTQAVPRQIAISFLLYKALAAISKDDTADALCSFMDEQLTGYAPVKKAKSLERNITFLGASYIRQLTIEEKYILGEHFNGSDVADDAEFFTKAIVNGNVFHCTNYRRDSRRKNYVVETKDNIAYALGVFAVVTLDGGCSASVAFGRQITFSNSPGVRDDDCGILCQHVKVVEEIDSALEIVDLPTIQEKFVLIKDESQQICCKLPNIIERD